MHSNVWDEIAYPNFNGCTIEVWEWISCFVAHFMMDVIIFSLDVHTTQLLAHTGPSLTREGVIMNKIYEGDTTSSPQCPEVLVNTSLRIYMYALADLIERNGSLMQRRCF